MPRHAAKKGVLLLALLFVQPLLVATQQQLLQENVDSYVEELRLPNPSHHRRHKFDTQHKHFRDTAVVSPDSSALATLAPAPSNDAVRAHPTRQASKSAGLSPLLQARSLQDWEVEDFVLLATVDGMIHARDRKTGAERWALQTDGPMVETIYHRNQSKYGELRPEDDFLWIIEPTRDGNVYIYSSHTPDGGLQKLDVTVKQLVEDHSPWSGIEPPVVYNAEKKTSLFTVDAATGEILKYFSSRPSTVEPDSCRRINNLEKAMEMECESRGTLTLGRIEYTVSIQSSDTGEHICTLRYFEWAPNNRDLDLQSQYFRTMDQRHIYTLHDGRVFGYDHAHATSKPTYTRKFSSPVARVFDVARPLHIDTLDTPLIILPQPIDPPNPEFLGYQFDARNSRIYINSTEEGSWYALSEQLYPMVTGGARKARIYDQEIFAPISQIRRGNLKQQRGILEGVHLINAFEHNKNTWETISGPIDPGNDTPRVVDPSIPPIAQRPALTNSIFLRAANEHSWDILFGLILCLLSTFVYVNKGNLNRFVRKKLDVRQIIPALQQPLASAPSTPIVAQAPWAKDLGIDGVAEKKGASQLAESGDWTMVDAKSPSEEENGTKVKIQEPENEERGDPNQAEKKKTRRGKRAGQAHKKNRKGSGDNDNHANGTLDTANLAQQFDPIPIMEPDIIRVSRTSSNDPLEVDGALQIGQLKVFTDVLGHGSHGTVVFKGSFDGRDVAVKRLLKEFFDIASHEVSLLQESDDHINVIRYYCREQAGGFLYIALELCPASLQDVVEKPDRFTSLMGTTGMNVPDALRQITAGVRHLHSLKIVHRDLKPQNILVAAPKPRKGISSTAVRLLISDFGLCKKLDDNQSSFRATTAHAAGTSGFRAPELLVDDDESPLKATSGDTSEPAIVDPQTNRRATRAIDIFSLGCVFYYVLTQGGHPFDDGGRFMREANIVKGKHNLDELQKLGDYAFEADDLIRQMLAKNPKDRPDATAVMLHPFFWSAEERLNFLCEVSDHFEWEQRDPPSPELQALEAVACDVMGQSMDFLKFLPADFKDTLGKQRKYTGSKMLDLLRALRNKKNHYQDMPESVKTHVGPLPHGYLQFWTVRFPSLLINCHCVVINCNLASKDRFKRYFTLVE